MINSKGEVTIAVLVIGVLAVAGMLGKSCYTVDKQADTERMRICLEHGGQWTGYQCVGSK